MPYINDKGQSYFKNNPYFNKKELRKITQHTPVFVFSKKALLSNLLNLKNNLPLDTEICYSMKANSELPVLKNLNNAGASFEVASKYELELLKKIEVPAKRIIFGSSVKAFDHIEEFVRYGVDRFAVDSYEELLKIKKYAPGSKIYVRSLVNDKSESVFHMSEKFGVSLDESFNLLVKAKELGLITYGISFNVGSQAKNEYAWARGIEDVATVMIKLKEIGIILQMVNIGGGFPHQYENIEKFPNINQISKHIHESIKKLPYSVKIIAEPGRGLVANSYVLISSITEKIKRHNGTWLHIDAGVYNALLEAMSYQGNIRYHIETLNDHSSAQEKFILTGPCCDDLDVIDKSILLPKDIRVGDRLIIYDTGAYTFTLSTRFNGYPTPTAVELP